MAEQVRLVDPPHAVLGRGRLREVLAPGDRGHAERLADPGQPAAEPAEAHHAERSTGQIAAEADLPAACPHRGGLGQEAARQRQDQRHRELRGGVSGRPGAAHRDAEALRRSDVDRSVARAGRDQAAQVRQPLQQCSRKRRALAHDADDLERCQAGDQPVGIVQMIVEERHLDALRQHRPVGRALRDLLIVVEDRYPCHHASSLVAARKAAERAPVIRRQAIPRKGARLAGPGLVRRAKPLLRVGRRLQAPRSAS